MENCSMQNFQCINVRMQNVPMQNVRMQKQCKIRFNSNLIYKNLNFIIAYEYKLLQQFACIYQTFSLIFCFLDHSPRNQESSMNFDNDKFISKDLQPYHMEDEEIEKSSKEEEFFDSHLSRKKKMVFWIYLFTLLAFITAVLSSIVSSYDPVKKFMQSDNFYFSNQIVYEWNQGFITDIKVLKSTTNPNCPAGYQHAFNFDWRGTGFGCLCQSGQNTTFVLQAYCSPSLIQSNCTNIGSQDQRTTHFWRNTSNICIKRSTVSFANEKKFDNLNKICGSSQSLVVVPQSEPCPLVNISMTGFSLQDHNMTAQDTNNLLPKIYGAFNSTSPYSFFSYPVSKFTVSEYEFCHINEDSGLSPSHIDFILLSIPRGCVSAGNYTQIDKTTQLDFYTNNPNLHSLTQIKGFPEAGNWEYKLGFGSVPSWTYRCRHNLNGKFSIENASKQFNFKIYSFLQAGSLVMIVSCIIIACEIFILGLRRCVNNSIYPVGYKQQNMPNHFWWSLSRYIVDLVCKILIIVMSALFTLNGYIDWHWYKEVQNKKCHHDNMELVEMIIKPNQEVHLNLFSSGLAVFLISICMLIIDGFHFYYIYHNELTYYLVQENQRLVDKDLAENKQGSLDRLNDLKWLEVQNVEELQADKNDDELRITMAQNMFGNEDNQPQLASKLKKKKKKTTTKKLFDKEPNKQKQTGNGAGYLFEDDIFGALDNSQQPSTTVLKSSNPKKRTNIKRKK